MKVIFPKQNIVPMHMVVEVAMINSVITIRLNLKQNILILLRIWTLYLQNCLGKKTKKYFVAQVTEKEEEYYNVKFLRRNLGKTFYYAVVDDIGLVVKHEIAAVLDQPTSSSSSRKLTSHFQILISISIIWVKFVKLYKLKVKEVILSLFVMF